MMKYGSQRRKPERACRTYAKARARAQIAEQLDSLQESEAEVTFELFEDYLRGGWQLEEDYADRGYDDDDFYLDETQGGRYKEFPREWEMSSFEEGQELEKLLQLLPSSSSTFPDALDRLNK